MLVTVLALLIDQEVGWKDTFLHNGNKHHLPMPSASFQCHLGPILSKCDVEGFTAQLGTFSSPEGRKA